MCVTYENLECLFINLGFGTLQEVHSILVQK